MINCNNQHDDYQAKKNDTVYFPLSLYKVIHGSNCPLLANWIGRRGRPYLLPIDGKQLNCHYFQLVDG
jgi:hypothetical protein